ncbi:MAG: hypothetical protein ABI120_12620, partial [Gemmatimonadaceae bacterium]
RLMLQEGATTRISGDGAPVFAVGGRQVSEGARYPGILLIRRRESQWERKWIKTGATTPPTALAMTSSLDSSISLYFERTPVDSIENGRGIYVINVPTWGESAPSAALVRLVPPNVLTMRPRAVELPNGVVHVFWLELQDGVANSQAYLAHAWKSKSDTTWDSNTHHLTKRSINFFDVGVNASGALFIVLTDSNGALAIVDASQSRLNEIEIQTSVILNTFWSFDIVEFAGLSMRLTWSVPPTRDIKNSGATGYPKSMTGLVRLACRP